MAGNTHKQYFIHDPDIDDEERIQLLILLTCNNKPTITYQELKLFKSDGRFHYRSN